MTQDQLRQKAEEVYPGPYNTVYKEYQPNEHTFELQEAYIKGCQDAMRWRDVTKELPEKSGEYLGLVMSYDSYTNYIVYWRKDRRTWEVYGLGRREPVTDMNVIKWQELPDLSEYYPEPGMPLPEIPER